MDNFLLVSTRKLDFPSLGKSLGNGALGRFWDPKRGSRIFGDMNGGTDPQTPKPFTHVPDTYLKYPNLEYNDHPHVALFVTQPVV